jgi:LuxR family maltose regulon positive regulatory protein
VSPGSEASPEPTAPERVNVELDEILATKLSLPRIRPDFLPRPQLVDALDEGVAKELVLVCTPAGFGKTTLLATWAQQHNRPVAWLSLDPGDNDPTRFWRYVIAAVGRVRSGFGTGVLPRLACPDHLSPEAVATTLVNAFAALPENLVLVLDDYHVLETTPVHDALKLLLSRLPPQACVVISTRSDPPLPLAQLRARDQLVELRAADLRFTTQEVACLLREVWGLDLTMEAAAALADRTEGWVAGLQLAAISLRGRSDPARLVDAFAGSNRYLIDYLTEEVLERQPGDLRTFLLDTSGLERLSGPFCDAVTGRCDGQQMLEALERANLFLVPLDDERRWYRYHHLFADMLRVRLQRFSPQRLPELHRRAATWCEAHGLIDDAIGYALGASDPSWAARLVEQHTDAMLRRGEGATLGRWLARLPPQVRRSRPRLCLAQATVAFNAGRLDVVEPLLQDAERATPQGQPPESRGGAATSALGNVSAAVALLRASLAGSRGDAEQMIQFAQQAQAHLDAGDRAARFAVRWNLALGDWMRGRMPRAERALAAIAADGWEADQPHLALTACCVLGRVQHARGRLGGAGHLPTGARGRRSGGRPGLAGRRHVARGDSRGAVRAQRTRSRPPARHRGRRLVQAAGPRPVPGDGACHAGLDPQRNRGPGQRPAGDRRGGSGGAKPGHRLPAQPGAGGAGAPAAAPGRARGRRSLDR